jgi:hypothetical protein
MFMSPPPAAPSLQLLNSTEFKKLTLCLETKYFIFHPIRSIKHNEKISCFVWNIKKFNVNIGIIVLCTL